MRILTATVFACILMTWGCSTDECYQNKNALPLAGFYDSSVPDSKLAIDSVQVYGVGAPGDSILSPGTGQISSLYMPFRLDSDTTRYVFRYLQKNLQQYDIRDTVTFIYSRNPRFVSSACGASYVFDIDTIKVTGLLIDSVVCPGNAITNMATENLRIYFRVAHADNPDSGQQFYNQ